MLSSAFGDDEAFTLAIGPNQRQFTSMSTAALDAANSRVWGGIHFRFDSEAGLQMGGQIANLALANPAFNAVPEPASWAMMFAGFGLVGGALRRRRVRVAYA